MIDFNVVEKALYDFVSAVIIDVPIIHDHQDAPRPTPPYIAIGYSTLSAIGQDAISGADVDGNAKIIGDRELMVELNAFGADAMGRLANVYNTIFYPDTLESLSASGLAFVDLINITKVPVAREDGWEEHAVMELRFRLSDSRTIAVGTIESTEITENYL